MFLKNLSDHSPPQILLFSMCPVISGRERSWHSATSYLLQHLVKFVFSSFFPNNFFDIHLDKLFLGVLFSLIISLQTSRDDTSTQRVRESEVERTDMI